MTEYEKQTEALEKIADIASEAGLFCRWWDHVNTDYYYFDGDWEEGEVDIGSSVDRMTITRTVDEDGSEMPYDD